MEHNSSALPPIPDIAANYDGAAHRLAKSNRADRGCPKGIVLIAGGRVFSGCRRLCGHSAGRAQASGRASRGAANQEDCTSRGREYLRGFADGPQSPIMTLYAFPPTGRYYLPAESRTNFLSHTGRGKDPSRVRKKDVLGAYVDVGVPHPG